MDISRLRHPVTGEPMHSKIGAWEEANALYVQQSGLERLLSEDGDELVLYDVGLGVGANALAALQCWESLESPRAMQVISFETELGALEMAAANPEHFPFLGEWVDVIRCLLKARRWTSAYGGLRWEIREGDFLEQDLKTLSPPDLVYFDFYSPKSSPECWTSACFSAIREVASPRCRLYTYSAATAVRSALLLAGFHVGYGPPTGAKVETTAAALQPADVRQPLGQSWLEHLKRSQRPVPPDWIGREEEALKRITSAPQFTA